MSDTRNFPSRGISEVELRKEAVSSYASKVLDQCSAQILRPARRRETNNLPDGIVYDSCAHRIAFIIYIY